MHNFDNSDDQYLKGISSLKRLKDLQPNELNETDFLVAEGKVIIKTVKGGLEATICIGSNPRVANTQLERRLLEGDPHPSASELRRFRAGEVDKVNWTTRVTAGGALLILRDGYGRDYIIVGQKDGQFHDGEISSSVVHSLHLTAASGLSKNTEQWIKPGFIVTQECFEEHRIVHRTNDAVYYPLFRDFGSDTQRVNNQVKETCSIRQLIAELSNNEQPRRMIPCAAELLSLGTHKLTIEQMGNTPRQVYNRQFVIVVDPKFGAIDLMGAVRMHLPEGVSIDDVMCLDGESVLGEGFQCNSYDHFVSSMGSWPDIAGFDLKKKRWICNQTLLNRPTYSFSPEELIKVLKGHSAKALLYWNAANGYELPKVQPGDELTPGITQFDRKDSRYRIEGVPVRLHEMPWINPPLFDVAYHLLHTEYGTDQMYPLPYYPTAELPGASIPKVTVLRQA